MLSFESLGEDRMTSFDLLKLADTINKSSLVSVQNVRETARIKRSQQVTLTQSI